MSTINQQALQWVVQRTEHGLSAAQQAAFDAWFAADARHRGAYLRAVAIQETLRRGVPLALPAVDHVEHSAPAEAAAAPWMARQPRRTWLRYGGALAAVATVAVLVAGTLPERAVVLATAKGEQRRDALADQSIATLNSDSRLSVTLTRHARQVTLERGEAWFDVARDRSRPFTVTAGPARVRAVGTAFSVRHLGAHGAEVLVTEGRVEVSTAPDAAQRSVLEAGDRAVIGADTITLDRGSGVLAHKLAWRTGQLVFSNDTLAEAVAEFNRYSRRPLVIVDPQLGRKTLMGRYRIAEPEVFARDVGLFLDVPVVVGADSIRIGTAPR